MIAGQGGEGEDATGATVQQVSFSTLIVGRAAEGYANPDLRRSRAESEDMFSHIPRFTEVGRFQPETCVP